MKMNFTIFLAFAYRLFFKKINYKKIIFSSHGNVDFNHNAKYLFLYMLKHEKEYSCKFVINDKLKREELQRTYGDHFIDTKTFGGALEALEAGAWVMSVGLPVYMPLMNRKRFVLNLWHGMPFKKIGLATVTGMRRIAYKWIFSDNYSLVSSTSDFFKKIIADNFEIQESRVVCLGQPRNDQLMLHNDKIEILQELFDRKLEQKDRFVLYAPTFRDGGATEFFPFSDWDGSKFEKYLADNSIYIVIKAHRNEQTDLSTFQNNRILLMDNVEDVMSILNIFDALITDYSSIYIDYLLLNRPILFVPYDIMEYEKMRGVNYDYFEYTPGPKPETMVALAEQLKLSLDDINYYAEERKRVNEIFNEVSGDSCRMHSQLIKDELKIRMGSV